jgi:hypothetical protein
VESYDRFSARKCKEYLERKGFTAVEELMLPSIWLTELKQWDAALSKANRALKLVVQHPQEAGPVTLDLQKLSPAALEDVAVLEYVLGVSEIGMGNVDVGLVHLRTANVAIAQAELRRDALAVSEKYLTAAENPAVKQFDFDGRLRMMCKKAHEQLDAKKGAAAKK